MSMTGNKRATISPLGDTEILITREFDAPRHLVYRAYTTPELVRRWWCGQRGEVTVCEIELRVGGDWRYVLRAYGGFDVGFHGVFGELVPNERIVSTEVFEGMPDAESLTTATFAETNGRTTLSILVQHTKPEHRDAQLESGMEGGLNEAFDLLQQIAAAE